MLKLLIHASVVFETLTLAKVGERQTPQKCFI